MGDVILCLENSCSQSSSTSRGSFRFDLKDCCRICHEEESVGLEAPCACSGTVKFAHRDCIQRWCNEKGNATCELCFQQYEPHYTAPSPSKNSKQFVPIRASVELPRDEEEHMDSDYVVVQSIINATAFELQTRADRFAACCRSVALILTVFLLMKHVCAIISSGAEDYPFTVLTLLILRSSGIIVPMYLFIRTISAIQNSIRKQCQPSGEGQLGDATV